MAGGQGGWGLAGGIQGYELVLGGVEAPVYLHAGSVGHDGKAIGIGLAGLLSRYHAAAGQMQLVGNHGCGPIGRPGNGRAQ